MTGESTGVVAVDGTGAGGSLAKRRGGGEEEVDGNGCDVIGDGLSNVLDEVDAELSAITGPAVRLRGGAEALAFTTVETEVAAR